MSQFPPPSGRFPPPPGKPAGAPPQQLNQAMGKMNIGGQPPAAFPGAPSAPPPPGSGQFRPPPGQGFQAPPPPGQGFQAPPKPQFQPPPPGNFAPPPAAAAPPVFQPPPPGASMHPPPPGASFQAPPSQQGPPAALAQPFYQPPAGPGAPPAATAVAAAPIENTNIDLSIKIPERLCRFATGKVPQTAGQASAAKIPLGGLLRPLAPDGTDDDPIPTVQPGSAGIVRCKRCRTYINAFVTWSEHGRRWRCNICSQLNDTPSAYFCHLDEQGLRQDRAERPELSQGAVEFIAPAEYMVRPPQEPTYFFVLDVSATAVRSGMLWHAAKSIKASLDDLPGGTRTKVGFVTFDNAVHYYNLASDLSSAQMLVVADLKELFVPLPDHLLVNLDESRSVVESFLDSLPEMFQNPVEGQSCLGPALKAAFTVMKNVGGKMCVFQALLPTLGDGALKMREQRGVMGTPNEVKLLKPEVTWYKDTAVEFSRQQISVNMFLFPYSYMDLAALGELPRYTAGSMYSYVMFNPEQDGQRFEDQLNKVLTTTTAFEAVMRIRCTKGVRITNVYGNFYVRGTDLLALPNCNSESVFAFEFVHDEQNVASSYVTVQAALLYTSSEGERRIRVMTQALPVTSMASEVVASIDADTCTALMAKQALDVSVKSSLDNARMRLQQHCIDIIKSAKGGDKRTVSGYSVPPPRAHQGMDSGGDDKPIPDRLQLLPLYTLATMKNVAFRGGSDVHPDERIQAHHSLINMFVEESKLFVYPKMFAIHSMGGSAGLPSEDGGDGDVAGRDRIKLPAAVHLSIDSLSSDGVYLLDNGVEMYLWVGRNAPMDVLSSLFGMQTIEDMNPSELKVLTSGDDLSNRVGAIMNALREKDGDPYVLSPKIHIVKEGDVNQEGRFFWFLVEDRASFQGGTFSYADFVKFVNNPTAAAGAGQPARVGPAPPGGMSAAPPGPAPPGPAGPPNGMPPQQPTAPSQPRTFGGPPNGMPPQQPTAPSQPRTFGGPPTMPQAPPAAPGSGPLPSGPPQGYGAPPAPVQARGPPKYGQGPPPPQNYGAPPPRQVGPPSAPQPPRQPGPPAPPVPGPPRAGFAAPPPRATGGPPPPPGRAVPQQQPAAPPPPRRSMPPPPPPRR